MLKSTWVVEKICVPSQYLVSHSLQSLERVSSQVDHSLRLLYRTLTEMSVRKANMEGLMSKKVLPKQELCRLDEELHGFVCSRVPKDQIAQDWYHSLSSFKSTSAFVAYHFCISKG